MHEAPSCFLRKCLPLLPEKWPRLKNVPQLSTASVAHIASISIWQLFPGLGGHRGTAIDLAIFFWARSLASFTVYDILAVLGHSPTPR